MRILNVYLDGIKSYDDGPKIAFHPGINFISGRNGSGKSTLLEAIGFALFDFHNYSRAGMMLRNGDKTGKIEITFTLDGTTAYTATRMVKSKQNGAWTIREVGDDLELASGEEPCKTWLRKNFKLAPDAKLDELYSQVIGVPQGEITTYFKETSGARCKHFDPLMGTESYRTAGQNSSGMEGLFHIDIEALNNTLARLEERTITYDGDRERFSTLSTELVSKDKEKIELQKGKDEIEKEVFRIKTQKDELDNIEKTLHIRTSEKTSASDRLTHVEDELNEAEVAKSEMTASADGHSAYKEASEAVKLLEPQLKDRDAMVKERNQLGEKIAKAEGTIATEMEGLFSVNEALKAQIEQRNATLANLTDQIKELTSEDQQLAIFEERQEKMAEITKSISDIAHDSASDAQSLKDWGIELERLDIKKTNLEKELALVPDHKSITEMIDAVEQSILDNRSTIANLETKIEDLLGLQGEDGLCPITNQPCQEIDPTSIRDKIEMAKEQWKEACSTEASLKEEKRRLSKERKISDNAEVKTDRLKELDEEIAEAKASIEEFGQRNYREELKIHLEDWSKTARLLKIGTAPPKFEGDDINEFLNGALPELEDIADDDRKKLLIQRNGLNEKKGTLRAVKLENENELVRLGKDLKKNEKDQLRNQEKKEKMVEAIERIASLNAELESLEIKSATLAEARTIQALNFELHQKYEINKKMAARAEGLAKEKEELLLRISQIGIEIEEMNTRKNAMNEILSPGALDEAQQRLTDLAEVIAANTIELKGMRKEEKELKQKLLAMQEALKEKEEKEAMASRLRSMAQTSKAVRDVLGKAGPLVAQRYREVVSELANAIFRTINEERADLEWRENYLVSLRDAKGEREFNQLSGGEQMTAALSVQLALAKEFSDLGVAMFDEPTTNMDKERRNELAKIIGRIKETYGFEQLFVISHDESFETMTEQVIRLEKVGGATKLAQEL